MDLIWRLAKYDFWRGFNFLIDQFRKIWRGFKILANWEFGDTKMKENKPAALEGQPKWIR